MKIQNMLMLLLLCLVGGMQAAAEFETETGTVRGQHIKVYNNEFVPTYYVKISQNVRGLSSDPVVYEGIPLQDGTDIRVLNFEYPLRVTVYRKKPGHEAEKRRLRIGYMFIKPDKVKHLKSVRLISTWPPFTNIDTICFEFSDTLFIEYQNLKR